MLDQGKYDPGLCDRVFPIPYLAEGKRVLFARLECVVAEQAFLVLTSTFDAELVNFIRLRHELRPMGLRMLLPTEEQVLPFSRMKLSEFAQNLGIPYPVAVNSWFSRDQENLRHPAVRRGRNGGIA
jgi:hypothetical protein